MILSREWIHFYQTIAGARETASELGIHKLLPTCCRTHSVRNQGLPVESRYHFSWGTVLRKLESGKCHHCNCLESRCHCSRQLPLFQMEKSEPRPWMSTSGKKKKKQKQHKNAKAMSPQLILMHTIVWAWPFPIALAVSESWNCWAFRSFHWRKAQNKEMWWNAKYLTILS